MIKLKISTYKNNVENKKLYDILLQNLNKKVIITYKYDSFQIPYYTNKITIQALHSIKGISNDNGILGFKVDYIDLVTNETYLNEDIFRYAVSILIPEDEYEYATFLETEVNLITKLDDIKQEFINLYI